MDKLREKYYQLTKQKAPSNMTKSMLEKYIIWYDQVKKEPSLIVLKELQQLLKGTSAPTCNACRVQLVREYQGKKHEVSMHPDGCFFYGGKQYKSLSRIAREITGTNWNGKLFFRVSGTKVTR